MNLPDLLAVVLTSEEAVSAQDATADRILDAALAEAAAAGIGRLTMDGVARRGRIGRMTVYRRFGQRERLVQELFIREFRRFLAAVATAAGCFDAPDERMAEAFVTALRLARAHPLVSHVASTEPETMIEVLLASDGQVFAMGRAFVAEGIREIQREGHGHGVNADQAAELLARVFLSFVLLPDSLIPLDSDDGARAFVRELIAPIVIGPR